MAIPKQNRRIELLLQPGYFTLHVELGFSFLSEWPMLECMKIKYPKRYRMVSTWIHLFTKFFIRPVLKV